MASVTVNLTRFGDEPANTRVYWLENVSIGSTFAMDGSNQTIDSVTVWYGASLMQPAGSINISLTALNDRFTVAFETSGRFIFEASDSETLEVMIANAIMSEPYLWVPSNSAEVIAFANHVRGLSDGNATLTLTDDPLTVAPSFSDDTGLAQSWTQNTTIPNITVPEAEGIPDPTYAVVGNLPAGIAFNTGTRVISGTPNAVGSGTITIRATNSEGMADWTVTYTTAVQPVAPNFADDTGNAQTWTVDASIAAITVPAATGTPSPTYTVVGTLPDGISFNADTRVISGIPTATGSGRIRIRATNSAGQDTWRVDYTTAAPPIVHTAPSFADDTGDAQTWTTGQGIFPITVPTASGVPTPMYFSVGALPAGLSFNMNTRVISGAPSTAGSGTITIRASNSEGSDDWTLAYTITDPPPEPVTGTMTYTVIDDDGNPVSIDIPWTVNPP